MSDTDGTTSWCEEELAGVDLGDARLDVRLINMAIQLSAQPLSSINQACEDWADAKAAYRLFSNEKATLDRILQPHQMRTRERMQAHSLVLAVQDTTFLSYTAHPKTTGLGPIRGSDQNLSGLVMHTTLCVTPDGLSLGVLGQQIWARSQEKRGMTKAQLRNLPLEEKESYKWLQALERTMQLAPPSTQVVTVGDRGADVYELFVRAQELQTGLLIRASQDRILVNDERGKLRSSVQSAAIAGYLKVHVPEKKGQPERDAIVSVRFRSLTLQPPWRPKSPDKAPLLPMPVDAILAQEVDPPPGVTPLDWLLLTNIPVHTFGEAVERVRWYRCRWYIEVYFKVLKSGCKVEDCRLRTAQRLTSFLALQTIIAWRLFWLTYVNRCLPDVPCSAVLAEHEWQALYAATHRTSVLPPELPTVHQAVRWIARLGGFLGRKRDGEPGVTVIWRGWQRLSDISATWLLIHQPAQPSTYG
jgi:hypothetical protein